MNKDLIRIKVKELYNLFQTGQIPTLSQHEVHPELPKGDRMNYLYFTLPVVINFQRNSPAMWQSAFATWQDPETNYLFFPEKVVSTPWEKLQVDLRRHKLSLQKNKHTLIWSTICQTLHEYFRNDPRKILAQGKFNVPKILSMLQVEHKNDFPYLRGLKMANYWLYILTKYTDLKLSGREYISIIPDTHVIQSSIHLGLVSPSATPEEIVKEWFNLLAKTKISPVDMHPVLWNWSRNNFQPEPGVQ